MTASNLTIAHCNTCGGERSHTVNYEHSENWRDEITDDRRDDIHGIDKYEVLKCAGCGHVVFRQTALHSQVTDDDGNEEPMITYSPRPIFRRKPSLLSTVGGGLQFIPINFISELTDEIYTTLHSDCRRLTAMGIRALLEHVIIDKVGDKRSFKRNLKEFQDRGYLSESEKHLIESALEVGHASIHRDYKPELDILLSCLDISEALIKRLYLLPLQVEAINKVIPKR